MQPGPEAMRLGAVYALGLRPPPTRGPSGTHKGRGTGASVEFQDHRDYLPGDDVRKLDWRAFARTDKLLVKRYREEVQPTLELLVDCSRSMMVDDNKARRAVELAAVVGQAAASGGYRVRVWPLGVPERRSLDQLLASGLRFESPLPLVEALRQVTGRMSAGGVALLISDFLSPHEAPSLVRSLAARSAALGLVQVLGGGDIEPALLGASRIQDAETGQELDITLDDATVQRYLGRLQRLTEALSEESRRAGARFCQLDSREPLAEACRRLLQEQILSV